MVERELAPGSHTIGRSPENSIHLDDISVSRRHARIVVEDGAISVEDLGSSGGTIAGGARLSARTAYTLREGDTLRFGDVDAEIVQPPATSPADSRPLDVPAGATAAAAAGVGIVEASPVALAPPSPVEADSALAPSFRPGDIPEPGTDPTALEEAAGAPTAGGAEPATLTSDLQPGTPDGADGPSPDVGDVSEEGAAVAGPPEPAEDEAPPISPEPVAPAGSPTLTSPLFAPTLPDTGASPFAPLPPAPPASAPPPSRVRMSVALAQAAVDAGQALTATVSLANRGNIVEELLISVGDIPVEWVTISPQTIPLMPNAQATATITIRPPKNFSARAADYAFTVNALSAGTGQEAVAVGAFTLTPFQDLAIALEPAQAARDFRVEVRNNGNAPGALTMDGRDDEDVLRFDLGEGRIELEPGESGRMPVRVKPGKRPWTGPQQVKPFKLRLMQEEGGALKELDGRLMVSPRIGSPRRLLLGAAALIAALAGAVALLVLPGQCGNDDDSGLVVVPTPTPVPPEVLAKEEDGDSHLCAPDEGGPPPPPAAGSRRERPAVLAGFSGDGIDPTAPLFAQNDTRWGNQEYAKARDDEFRNQNLCGSSISQCGCAMSSVATVMTLFQLATMPDGQALTPEQLNNWMNIGAKKTARGWVSQGYIYGDVIWATANQLSAEIERARPGTPTVRFRGTGSGAESQVRAELQAGRPIILEVPGHWIAAVGIDPATNKILINDPFYADRTTLDVYAGKVRSSVLFEASDDLSALIVTVPSDLRVRLIGPGGHVVGTFDRGSPDEAAKKALRDIPGASYVFRHTWRDPNCINRSPGPDDGTNQIVITGPDAGKYRIEVVNPNGGSTSVAVHLYDKDGNLSVRTDDKNGDQRIDIEIAGPTPTPTSTGTITPTSTATRTPTAAATGTTAPTTASTATTAAPSSTTIPTPTISPTAGPLPPTTNSTCTSQRIDGPYPGNPPSETRRFTCQGSFTPAREGTVTNWYVIEPDGAIAPFADYRNSPTFQYDRLVSSGETFTIRFEACYQGACSKRDVTATVGTIIAPTPTQPPTTPCTPSGSDSDGDCVSNTNESTYGSNPSNPASTPENFFFLPATCNDGVDNDKDTLVDQFDQGCQVIT